MTFLEVFNIYLIIILEFLLELYVFCGLFLHKLERADRFILKAVLGLAAVAAIAFPVAWFYYAFGSTVWGRIAVYLFLFGVVVAHARLCFKNSLRKIIFCCSMAYAAQNLVYKLFLIFWCFGEGFNLFEGWGASFDLWYRIVYYTFFATVSVAMWFVFIRSIVNRLYKSKLNYGLLAITVVVLAITIILCSFEDVYFAKLSVGRENRFNMHEYYILRQTGNAFSAICCGIVLLLASKTIVQYELLQEVEYLKYSIRQGQRQYEISKDTIDLINVKIHDIKYKINCILAEQKGIPSEALDDLRKSIRIYDANIETGNELLNVFITDKSLYCEQNGITLSCMIDGSKLHFMDAGDLYCLFGNIVDNALESVIKINEKEKRIINLTVKCKNDMLFIQSDNYFTGKITFRDGLPLTTKSDVNYHGFGMQSIKLIVKKYGGELTTYATDDIFHLSILFSNLPAENTQNKK